MCRTDFSEKNVLITGSTGFIGCYVLNELNAYNCHVIRLSRQKITHNPTFSNLEIHDRIGPIEKQGTWENIFDEFSIDYVFHLAAQTSFYKAAADPRWEFECNVVPILALLECCKKSKQSPVIIYTGTVSQYGLNPKLPVKENHPDCPTTIHDLHKTAAENYLKFYTQTNLVKGTSLRLANVYGIPLGETLETDRGVLNKVISSALDENVLQLYGTGDYIRDFIHVSDVAKAIVIAAIHIDKLTGNHWIISYGKGFTLEEVFKLIVEYVRPYISQDIQVNKVLEPEGMLEIEKRHFVGDISKFSEITGWVPQITLEEGLKYTVKKIADPTCSGS